MREVENKERVEVGRGVNSLHNKNTINAGEGEQ